MLKSSITKKIQNQSQVSQNKFRKKVVTTEILEDVVKKTTADKISIGELMTAMDSGGFALVMTLFSLPIFIPLPPPLPSFIALPILFFSFQMMVGYNVPHLPKKLSNFSISRSLLAAIVEKSAPYIKKAESIVKPRLLILSSDWFIKIIGVFCFAFGFSILFPIPLSNFIPGIGVLITSFGLLGRDGLIILFGLTIGCMGVVVTMITLFLGAEAIALFKNFFLGWM